MSRKTVALASPSRNVRMRPGCSSRYQRPAGPWNARVIELNASPFIARTRRTCGIVVAPAVGTGVGGGVGDELGVGDAVGDGVGVGLGVAVAREPDAAASGVGDVDGTAAGVAEQAQASARTGASASRRAPMTFTGSTTQPPGRCDDP